MMTDTEASTPIACEGDLETVTEIITDVPDDPVWGRRALAGGPRAWRFRGRGGAAPGAWLSAGRRSAARIRPGGDDTSIRRDAGHLVFAGLLSAPFDWLAASTQ
jgi:hypothetical protein